MYNSRLNSGTKNLTLSHVRGHRLQRHFEAASGPSVGNKAMEKGEYRELRMAWTRVGAGEDRGCIPNRRAQETPFQQPVVVEGGHHKGYGRLALW